MNQQPTSGEERAAASGPDIRIEKPTADLAGTLVEGTQRYVTCQVTATINGFPPDHVQVRAYGPGEEFPVGNAVDPSATSMQPLTTNKKQWCLPQLRYTFSLPATSICAAAAPYPQHKLKVWAWLNSVPYPAELPLFFAKCGTPTACVPIGTIDAENVLCGGPDATCAALPLASASNILDAGDVTPTRYIYTNLRVDDMFDGNRLMVAPSVPFRAKRIAVFAKDVDWHNGANKVRSCLGNRLLADDSFRFKETFEYSIVINQPGIKYQMVLSERRRRPQTIELDPTSDVYVQVNDRFNPAAYADNTGGFSLHVRVLE